MKSNIILFLSIIMLSISLVNASEKIPLPEHPRPDLERQDWINLNGTWNFTFDKQIAGTAIDRNDSRDFDLKIQVPFGWGTSLSGVDNKAHEGWYSRPLLIPESWKGKRVFLIIGASEWNTKVWLDGKLLGSHQGGYTPFEFELTESVLYGHKQNLIIHADDTPSDKRLGGKQGYGDVRGIWQTVYLEVRGSNYLDYVHFSPDIDHSKVKIDLGLKDLPEKDCRIVFHFKNGEQADFIYTPKSKDRKLLAHQFEIQLNNQHLWDLDDPYLYEMQVALMKGNQPIDILNTYFGQRKISIMPLTGTDVPYVALNNKPVYLQMCLDQSYHPEGYYTFPTDKFMRDEILLSKSLGLNGNRIHIKTEIPRKLYWADKLGLLIMADVPNWWGEPNELGKSDWEHCMRNQIKRDYNHPSIFAWVDFNETWGLLTKKNGEEIYEVETQEWVRRMYFETKKLDPTRLVEDNSPCRGDHVQTDLNTWHAYAPGYEWRDILNNNTKNSFPGSQWNFINGNKQTTVPSLNSECGNVWGYHGSTGDVDFTWDYHLMINEFRSHPKCAGWLYTEHHDVINEWNGYVRYDRTPKISGLDEFVPDMSIADFHSPYYIVPQGDLCSLASAGSVVKVPLFVSFMTDKDPGSIYLETELKGWDILGHVISGEKKNYDIPFKAFMNEPITPMEVTMPSGSGLYVLSLRLKDISGKVLGRNFTTFLVKDGCNPESDKNMKLVHFKPASFDACQWSLKQWNVYDSLKVNATGSGYFEYTIPWPEKCDLSEMESVSLIFEASAKELFGKDALGLEIENRDLDFMRGRGTDDPCMNKNSYAMTDQKTHPSMLKITVNSIPAGDFYLPDDPADHRGVLSWYAQPKNRTLSEAGSYGYLIEAKIPLSSLKQDNPIKIRLEVPEGINGGLAIYSKDFGRYPLDPTLLFVKK